MTEKTLPHITAYTLLYSIYKSDYMYCKFKTTDLQAKHLDMTEKSVIFLRGNLDMRTEGIFDKYLTFVQIRTSSAYHI